MLKDRKNYETALEAQLAEWKADLEVLKAKARRAEVGAKVEYDETLDVLERKHTEATARLQDLKASTDEAWEDLKTHTEKAWDDFKAVFRRPAHKD